MNIKDQQIDHRLSLIAPGVDTQQLRAVRAISVAIADFHAATNREDGYHAFQRLTTLAECVAAGINIAQNQ